MAILFRVHAMPVRVSRTLVALLTLVRVYSLFRLLAVAAAIQGPYATGQSPAFVEKGNRRLVGS